MGPVAVLRSGSFRTTRWRVRPRRQLGDQLLDLALGPVRSPGEHRLAVLPSQVGRQLGNGGQVKAPLAEPLQEHGVLPCGAGHGDAQVRLELGEVEHLRAVGEHGGRGLAGVEPAASTSPM